MSDDDIKNNDSFWSDFTFAVVAVAILLGIGGFFLLIVGLLAISTWTEWHATEAAIAEGDRNAGLFFLFVAAVLTIGLVATVVFRRNERWAKQKRLEEEEAKERKRKEQNLIKRMESLGIDPEELRDLLR